MIVRQDFPGGAIRRGDDGVVMADDQKMIVEEPHPPENRVYRGINRRPINTIGGTPDSRRTQSGNTHIGVVAERHPIQILGCKGGQGGPVDAIVRLQCRAVQADGNILVIAKTDALQILGDARLTSVPIQGCPGLQD